MAAREHRVSRRVLLGAACAPVLSLVEGPALAPFPLILSLSKDHPELSRRAVRPELVEGWRRGLTLVRRAETRLRAAEGGPDEARFDRRLGAFYRALRRLLRTPAPNLPALALKIDLTIDHDIATLTGGEACMAALARDAHRLAR